MKPSKTATRTVTLDPVPAAELEVETAAYADDLPLDDAAEHEAALCPVCRELLAWHEHPCAAAAAAPPADDVPTVLPPASAATFAFALGHRVQPVTSAPAAVTWRGQHKERHPDTGLVHRINVYALDNGYWDCYR